MCIYHHGVQLLQAHRILIGTFVAFSIFLSVFAMRQMRSAVSFEAVTIAIAGVAMAVGFGIYLKRIWNKAL